MKKVIVWIIIIFAGIAAGFYAYTLLTRSSVTNPIGATSSNSISSSTLNNGPTVAFGDSLIAGTGATQGHDLVSDLSAMIGEPIVNDGVSGNTTADGLARINEVTSLDPSIVIVLLGGNDALQSVPIDETFQNLSTIVTDLQANGARVVLLGVQGSIGSDPYASRFAALAAQKHVVYVPNVLAGIIGSSTLMSDEVHPDDAGYELIAQKVYAAMAPLVAPH